MTAKPVQISLDVELLERIDADPEAKAHGRSAFVRAAVERYLAIRERNAIDARIRKAYGGAAEKMRTEASDFMDAQQWPDD